MNRLSFAGLVLVGMTYMVPDAAAIEWWHDPERGCGTLDGWQRTSRLKDLPGCDAELPRGAPPGEVAMHDAKKALHEAEKILDAGQSTDVESKLDAATNIMNKAPNDPRVNWARPHFQKAVNLLRAKLSIVPRLARLRQVYKAAMDASETANRQKTDAARKSAMLAVDACVQAFREAEAQGADLGIAIELTQGKPRPLRDDMRECASGRPAEAVAAATPDKPAATGDKPAATGDKPAATGDKPAATGDKPDGDKPAAAAGGGGDGGVPRAKWAKALKGDRKKVFQDHPDAFPEFDGDPGPKGAVKAAEWRYGSESFQFKKNKLVKPKTK